MNFGQFRRAPHGLDVFFNSQEIELSDDVKSTYGNILFKDTSYACSLIYGNSYALRFSTESINLKNNTLTFYIKLVNKGEEGVVSSQTIGAFKQSSGYLKNYEIIITPNQTYDYIVFEIEREEIDFKNINNARKIQNSSIELLSITNLLDGKIDTDRVPLKHIGIQGPKGLLMCINGEEIRIGHSGFYEIDNKIDINFFGVVVKEDSNKKPLTGGDIYQDFILDYEY